MVYKFDIQKLKTQLNKLQNWQRIAFGVFLLERALPNFLYFQVETGAHGGGILRAALAQLWNSIEHDGVDNWGFITPDMCGAVAPDTERYTSLYTSSALDAASIAENQIRYGQTGDEDLIIASAGLRRDSIDIFVQTSEEIDSSRTDFEDYLVMHPLMQQELSSQYADIAFLANASSDREVAWRQYLRRSIELGYGQFRMKVGAYINVE